VNKFEKCGLHKEQASEISCPLIAESPLSLECRVTDVIELGSHHMFLADIVAVDVDDSLLNGEGKLCLDNAKLAAFSHGEYFALGEKIGYFGFSVKKKKKKLPPKQKPKEDK
jgi:flavin reductase (DIM6/NTAB) family NADH-FMN oxidoreductase RutF